MKINLLEAEIDAIIDIARQVDEQKSWNKILVDVSQYSTDILLLSDYIKYLRKEQNK